MCRWLTDWWIELFKVYIVYHNIISQFNSNHTYLQKLQYEGLFNETNPIHVYVLCMPILIVMQY